MAVLTALVMSLLLGPRLIRYLQERQIGEVIRDDGPRTHMAKKGTPTMGGVLILFCVVAPVLLWNDLANGYIWLALFVLLAYGVLGFWDDYKKVMGKDKNGVRPAMKFLAQGIIGLITWAMLCTAASCGSGFQTRRHAALSSRTSSPTSESGSCPTPLWSSFRRATP